MPIKLRNTRNTKFGAVEAAVYANWDTLKIVFLAFRIVFSSILSVHLSHAGTEYQVLGPAFIDFFHSFTHILERTQGN